LILVTLRKKIVLNDLILLFFPCCHRHLKKYERLICTFCRHDLPYGNYTNQSPNTVENCFYGKVPLVAATALFRFRENGKIQNLIHALKYENKESVGLLAANLLGQEILNSDRFPAIDLVIPVPLHPKKQRKRGYNQNTAFGQKLAEILSSEFCGSLLIRKRNRPTQTQQTRMNRWRNIEGSFSLENPEKLANKQVLLIDDVITTGATLEACCNELLKADVKISIATIACAENF
jgi:competence protein ComFC